MLLSYWSVARAISFEEVKRELCDRVKDRIMSSVPSFIRRYISCPFDNITPDTFTRTNLRLTVDDNLPKLRDWMRDRPDSLYSCIYE